MGNEHSEKNPVYWQKNLLSGEWERVVPRSSRSIPRNIFNFKRQLYKKLRLEGKTEVEAYIGAGYNPNSARSNAYKLEKVMMYDGQLTEAFKEVGITSGALAIAIKKKLNAKDVHWSEKKKKLIITIDQATQLKALDMVFKIRGDYKVTQEKEEGGDIREVLEAVDITETEVTEAEEQLQALPNEIPEDSGQRREPGTAEKTDKSASKDGDSDKQSNSTGETDKNNNTES